MKKNAVIPYGIIAVIGILLVIVLSTAGVFQRDSIQQEGEKGNTEEQADNGENSGGETENPEEIFKSNCMTCHGEDLQGKNGPALDKVGSELSKEEIKQTIIQGTDGGMPGGLVNEQKAGVLADWLSKKK